MRRLLGKLAPGKENEHKQLFLGRLFNEFYSRLAVEVHVAPETLGELGIGDTLVGVCIELGKGLQGEAESVERAGKADVAQHRRDHQIVFCAAIGAVRESVLKRFFLPALLRVSP